MEENFSFASGDHRWLVYVGTDQDLKNPPYCHIVRVMSYKICCGKFDNGTAFLVAKESDKHCYYLTAAHLLFCYSEEHRDKERLAKHVQLWESVKEGRSDSEQIVDIYSDGAYTRDKAWYMVNPLYEKTVQHRRDRLGHDLAVIAVPKGDMRSRNTKQGGFRAVRKSQLSDKYSDCCVSGFPGKAPNQGGGGGEAGATGGQSADADPHSLNEMIYEHKGEVGTYKSNGRLWKNRIHTTEGQSGSPVFVKTTQTLVGMHILGGDEHNLALKLDNEMIAHATSGFPQREDEVDGRVREISRGRRSTDQFTRDDFNQLEVSDAATHWKKIAESLRDRKSGCDALTDSQIENIRQQNGGDLHKCLTASLKVWTVQSTELHTIGEFCKVLQTLKIGSIAEKVFGKLD